MSETKDVKVLIGTKISDADAKALDRAKMGVAVAQRPAAQEVEGQQLIYNYPVECPWCFRIVYITYDTSAFHWYICGNCGNSFKA